MRSLLALILLALSLSCVAVKEAQLAAENVIDAPVVEEHTWGRVECGHGQVCSEVQVARVDVGRYDGGPVEVTLKNRTLASVAVQVELQTFDAQGRRTDRTGFHDVALAPRQESVLTLWQELSADERLVIALRARS
ncbi:MAG: hypothetical protein HYS27_13995 [Deltaproteobacteria bacterium]|nr:hypothetical protein [Deltaproteobacteria bacterium]